MRHFYRTHVNPATVVEAADTFFAELELTPVARTDRSRTWRGVVGDPETPSAVRLTVKPEGGHYTFVEVHTDQMGESRIDRNVKRFFVTLHRMENPAHLLEAAY
jgi:hypothetical protein